MATKQARKHNRRLISLTLPILVVIVVIAGTFFWYHQSDRKTQNNTRTATNRSVNSISYTSSSPSDNTANDARKGSPSPATTLNNGPSSGSNGTLSTQIVSANVNSGNIHIGTLVSGATTGTCTITATQGQTTVNLYTTSVTQDVNSYDCGGGAINVSASQLDPASGTWQLKLTVTSGGSQATNTASVNL